MRTKLVMVFISVFCFVKFNFCQNLIPNPSFENTIQCDSGAYLEEIIHNWYGGLGYYNSCFIGSFSTPLNLGGYQIPRTGNAYCGINTYFMLNIPIRNYIQCKLTQTLINNKKYKVCFYVSLADSVRIANNSIGALFTTDSFSVSNTGIGFIINQIPQVQNQTINDLSSKTNWTLVCDTFVASGVEKWITIGNFLNDSLSNTIVLDTTCTFNGYNCGAYYFIDDVSVELLDDTGIDEDKNSARVTILPNPNNGSFVITNHSHFNYPTTLIINNAFGQMVDEIAIVNATTNYENTSLINGLYFYTIRSKDQEIQRGKFLVSK